jgi:uncharacterized protein YukE
MTTKPMMAGEGTLARAAGMVSEARVDFDRLSATLLDRLSSAQTRWQGAGGAAFQGVARAWNDKQHTIVSALAEFEAHLRGTQASNLATDDQAMAAQNAHLHRLGGIPG